MILSTFETRIASAIGMNTADATEKSLIDGWTNEAVEQFLCETQARVSPVTFVTVAGQGDYDLLTVAPTALDIQDVLVTDSTGVQIPLDPMQRRDMLLGRQYSASGDTPRKYQLAGASTLRLYPTPSSVLTVTLNIVPKPASQLAAAGDDPSTAAFGGIPTRFHPVLEAYAKWKAADWDDDVSSQIGQEYKKEWEQGVEASRRRINKMAGPLAPARPGRRRRFPVRPGVDTGA